MSGHPTASPHASASASKTLVFVGERTLGEKYGPVQFSGAFGDYGKTEYVNAAGHPVASGTYFTAASPITSGTGSYAHVKGTLSVTLVSDFLLPRLTSGADKGQCNGNAMPLHAVSTYSGKGSVTL